VWFERAREDGYALSTDPGRLDRRAIQAFLRDEAYWSLGVPADVVDRSIDNSIPFGVYAPDGATAAFARVVTDRAAIAYLGDVFVLAPHRGRGVGKWLVASVLEHPDLGTIRTFLLGTADAHSLYEQFGFVSQEGSTKWMVRSVEPGELYG
jgi:GNAT superfamily N-acetyltransferase